MAWRRADRSIADHLFKVRLLATAQVLIVRRGQPSLICINPHMDDPPGVSLLDPARAEALAAAWSMIRKSMPSGLTRGWVPVFPRDKREAFARRSCSNKKIERDDDSKKSHPALTARQIGRAEHRTRLVAIAVLDIDHRGIDALAGNTFQRHGPVAGTAVPVAYLEQVAHHIIVGDLATAILAAAD